MITKSADSGRDAARWEAVEEAVELLQEDRYADALVELRDVLAKDPSSSYAYYFLGVAFYETYNLQAARDAYRAALRLEPAYLGARVALSHVLRELGDPVGALGQAREALRRFPNDADALHAAGLANAAKGDRPAARRQLTEFLETKPEFEVDAEVRSILEMLGLGGDDEPLEVESSVRRRPGA
jgi:tetratricopeptide (TPR) repeat protein